MDMIQHDCPWCSTRGAGFDLHRPGNQRELTTGQWFRHELLATCVLCHRSAVATIETKHSSLAHASMELNEGLVGLQPSPATPSAPQHTPPNVARYFEQGLDNLARNWDAAGTMFRKALDTGLTVKWPAIDGSLSQRIDKVAEQGGLTEELREWAHQIRLDGNDAAHELEPIDQAQANSLSSFVEIFLLYVFTLPAMLEEARQRRGVDTVAQ